MDDSIVLAASCIDDCLLTISPLSFFAVHARSKWPRPKGLKRAAWALFIFLVLLASWFAEAIHDHHVGFPRRVSSLRRLEALREPVAPPHSFREYLGIIHSHSALSHDCEVGFPSILQAMRDSGRHFICLSDHTDRGRADFGIQWRGLHDGRLFIPGYEMRDGWMPFGVSSDVVLSDAMANDVLAQRIQSGGGLLFFAHPEKPRDWDRPELVGMEIYNAHADATDGSHLLRLLPQLLVNFHKYPDLVLETLFTRPSSNLRLWDRLNRTRPVVGVGGNDIHQNAGLRLRCADDGSLTLEDTSPKTVWSVCLSPLARRLAEWVLGPLKSGRVIFEFQLAEYDRMARLVTTHVLAEALTEASILEALRSGRAFVAFDLIADSSGFQWTAKDSQTTAWMGGALPHSTGLSLHAISPLPCRFRVIRDGEIFHEATGRRLDLKGGGPGSYRVEAELDVAGEWKPWLYSNPIRVLAAETQGP